MKKLPIGIQTFKDIRVDDYIYVDKTKIALRLIEQGRYYFLSRPRRFGKSLFLDTLRCIFEGKQSLFKGLAIYNQWDWNKTYPVIHISFGSGVHKSKESLNKSIIAILKNNQKRLKVKCKEFNDAKACFAELIEAVHKNYGKVVILVDEYDKPILDNISDKPTARIMCDRLKNIYSVIFKNEVSRLFASIPYNNFTKNSIQNYEGYYASVMYTYLASLGYEIITEDTTNHSRIDLTLKMDKIIYIFELKVVDKPTGKALQQIKQQQYYQKYHHHQQQVYCIGMEFCKTERNLCLFEWEIH